MTSPLAGPIRVVVIGAGHRSVVYAGYALSHPDRMTIVAVVDPHEGRRNTLSDAHNVPQEARLLSVEQFLASGIQADAAINGTMDHLHHITTMPLIEHGLHVLLEKPIAPSEAEVKDIISASERKQRLVMICHVLRYAPFYASIKNVLDKGTIGDIMAIHTTEAVSYHHMATAFVRGKWNRRETSNPIMMAKCCHDLDLLAWYVQGVKAKRVTSVGALSHFKKENAPAGSTDRCLNGCAVESTCQFSAKKMYIEASFGFGYAFEMYDRELTREEKIHSLATDNRYGRCVWRCDNNVVDHQSVLIQFENNVTVTHDLVTNTARPTRNLHIVGTTGEIEGDMEHGTYVIRHFDLTAPKGFTEQSIDVKLTGGAGQGGHGGGDERLVADFVAILRGEKDPENSTRIQNSLVGHQIGFAAEKSMQSGQTVVID